MNHLERTCLQLCCYLPLQLTTCLIALRCWLLVVTYSFQGLPSTDFLIHHLKITDIMQAGFPGLQVCPSYLGTKCHPSTLSEPMSVLTCASVETIHLAHWWQVDYVQRLFVDSPQTFFQCKNGRYLTRFNRPVPFHKSLGFLITFLHFCYLESNLRGQALTVEANQRYLFIYSDIYMLLSPWWYPKRFTTLSPFYFHNNIRVR